MPAGPAARKKTIVISTGIIAPALYAMGKNDTSKKEYNAGRLTFLALHPKALND